MSVEGFLISNSHALNETHEQQFNEVELEVQSADHM